MFRGWVAMAEVPTSSMLISSKAILLGTALASSLLRLPSRPIAS